MTDEEKKAIHDLKILRSGIGFLNCMPGIEKDETDIKAIDIALNLINKLNNVIDRMAGDLYLKDDLGEFGDTPETIKEYFMKE